MAKDTKQKQAKLVQVDFNMVKALNDELLSLQCRYKGLQDLYIELLHDRNENYVMKIPENKMKAVK